jgi:hypothetical protein
VAVAEPSDRTGPLPSALENVLTTNETAPTDRPIEIRQVRPEVPLEQPGEPEVSGITVADPPAGVTLRELVATETYSARRCELAPVDDDVCGIVIETCAVPMLPDGVAVADGGAGAAGSVEVPFPAPPPPHAAKLTIRGMHNPARANDRRRGRMTRFSMVRGGVAP